MAKFGTNTTLGFSSDTSEHATLYILSPCASTSTSFSQLCASNTHTVKKNKLKINIRPSLHSSCCFFHISFFHISFFNSVIGVPFQAHTIFSTYHYGSHESKSISLLIRPSCHFSVGTHQRYALKPKLGILTGLQDPYLSTTSCLLIFHQHNHLTSKHC